MSALAASSAVAPQTPEQIPAFLRRFAVWVDASERAMRRWRDELSIPLALGVAPCAELQRYNQRAVGLWAFQREIIVRMRDAGLPLPEPPFPALFADRTAVTETTASDGAQRQAISWSLASCRGADALADRDQVRLRSPCPGEPLDFGLDGLGQLDGVPALVPVIGALLALGALVVGGGFAAARFIDSINEVPGLQENSRLLEAEGARDAERAAVANRCATERIGLLSSTDRLDRDVIGRIYVECFGLAGDAFPTRDVPRPSGAGGLVFALGLAGAAALGGAWLARRSS